MCQVNPYKLKQYINELSEYTKTIQHKKIALEKDFDEIGHIWDDVIFQTYLNQYNTLSRDIDIFISQSKAIEDKLNAKLIPLIHYLKS